MSEVSAQIPSLDDVLVRLQTVEEQHGALAERFALERLHWRVQTGLAVCITLGAVWLVPATRQAVAQGGNGNGTNARLDALEAKTQFMSVVGTTTRFTGTNVQILSGSGSTYGTVNSLGNLIIGYNENFIGYSRTGSHNLVVGKDHGYSSYGGLVAGSRNTISGPGTSVLGGGNNSASGQYAVVVGGSSNLASGNVSVVASGVFNVANAQFSAVMGGQSNMASANFTNILGGYSNRVTSNWATISGGGNNTASGPYASILGGTLNITSGYSSVLLGGFNNTIEYYDDFAIFPWPTP